jgi:hypothetical protein
MEDERDDKSIIAKTIQTAAYRKHRVPSGEEGTGARTIKAGRPSYDHAANGPRVSVRISDASARGASPT